MQKFKVTITQITSCRTEQFYQAENWEQALNLAKEDFDEGKLTADDFELVNDEDVEYVVEKIGDKNDN